VASTLVAIKQYIHVRYSLLPVAGQRRPAAGKVTVGLASRWPCVTDFSGLSTCGLKDEVRRWSPPPTLLLGYGILFTFYFSSMRWQRLDAGNNRMSVDRLVAVNGALKSAFICSSHLVWPDLSWPHFVRIECAATGRSRGELGRFASQRTTRFAVSATERGSALGSDELRSVKMRSDEVSEIGIRNTPNRRTAAGVRLSAHTHTHTHTSVTVDVATSPQMQIDSTKKNDATQFYPLRIFLRYVTLVYMI